MTSARDRPAADRGPVPAARSALTRVRGAPWWVCVLLGVLPALGCVTADVVRSGTVGPAFFVGYPLGCVLAVLAARRDGLFVPMVQPPLALAVAIPVAVAVAGSLPTSGGLATVLALAGPLIAGFPAMAITTTLCLALGGARLVLQPAAVPGGASTTRRAGAGVSSREGSGRRAERNRPDRPDRPGRSAPSSGSGSGRTPLRVTSRRATSADEEAGTARAPDRAAPRSGDGTPTPAGPQVPAAASTPQGPVTPTTPPQGPVPPTTPPQGPIPPTPPPSPVPQGPAGPVPPGPVPPGPVPPGPVPPGPVPPGPVAPGPGPQRPVLPVSAEAVPTEPAPRSATGSAAGTDEEPARRSPLVLPHDDDRERSGRPTPSRDAERRRQVREERMRADRMREERRREGQRDAAQADQRREADRRTGTEQWGPRRRPEG